MQNGFDSSFLGTIGNMQKLGGHAVGQNLYQTGRLTQMVTEIGDMAVTTGMPMTFISAFNSVSRKMISNVLGLYTSEEIQLLVRPLGILKQENKSYDLFRFPHDDNESDEENIEDEQANTKIVKEIFSPDREKAVNKESPIITLSPINEKVLRYLSEHPEAFYQLGSAEFEIVMAEIYSRLGYKVERTQSTRDGGKDIIIRKPEILGDFIYYVECKKYAPNNPIGVGIIRNLVGTINADRVNGGILATTSYFSRDARKFIIDYKYGCQIQMHDFDVIRGLLDKTF